ncbi:snaclec bothroinsularin subunit alpha-like [Gigantopelta aegis]|uniref:snaclec bothroinsularin subunit alpha-like n=1 Tax=Gigantopelta aegis TaxID=1735272 RepID=UPI001B88E68B|nr:snaclec bothroinsularin subunit alpha-like [Gigantopelta aegis]
MHSPAAAIRWTCFSVVICLASAAGDLTPIHECPPDWIPAGDHCYVIPQIENSWMSIMSLCAAYGGSLAHISSQTENDVIAKLARENHSNGNMLWIGGTT